MIEYNHKIIKGSPCRYENLKLARAKTIYKAAMRHPYVKDVHCYVNNRGDAIIRMHMTHLEIPDEPVYAIFDEEEIAIICRREDIYIPEVYALREDFPVELPHSNAKTFIRPVSLCVSDVAFADIRPQFNAFDFLNYIRRWFSLNSINKLHEQNRPLEMFFGFHEVCCILNSPSGSNPYVRYSNKTNFSSTLEYVAKNKATHYLIHVDTPQVHAKNFVMIPQTMGELIKIQSTVRCSLPDYILYVLTNAVAGKSSLPIAILVLICQTSKDDKNASKEFFLIKTENSPSEIVRKKSTLSPDAFEQWFNGLPINIALLFGMTSRAENAINNGIEGELNLKKVSIIGAGALGSAIIDHFVRQGYSEEVNIVDHDIMFPHNLSRHTLPSNKVMTSKVRSIKEMYNGIISQKINVFESNFFTLNHREKERLFNGTDLVMDFSTSIAVERMLANKENEARKCTSFLNPKGNEIVLMMEDQDRGSRLDLLEMDYYRNLILDEKFANHLEQPKVIHTNDFSCRSESMILNYENVRILSAIVSSQIRKLFFQKPACLCVWRFDTETGSVLRLPMRMTDWHLKYSGTIRVYISEAVKEEIKTMSNSYKDKETGGCLFGSYDRDFCIIYIYYMMPAPEDSTRCPMSFVRGSQGLTKEYERITKLTYHQVRYLGEWHSHPNMSNTPSRLDEEQFKEMWTEQQSQDLPFVQMIYGNEGLFVSAAM